jgi:hypothetical protein
MIRMSRFPSPIGLIGPINSGLVVGAQAFDLHAEAPDLDILFVT